MEILEINYIKLRNLIDGNIKFFPKLNLFFGKNGQGKTSILEAVYFNATEKVSEPQKASEAIKYGTNKMGVYLLYKDTIQSKSHCKIQ